MNPSCSYPLESTQVYTQKKTKPIPFVSFKNHTKPNLYKNHIKYKFIFIFIITKHTQFQWQQQQLRTTMFENKPTTFFHPQTTILSLIHSSSSTNQNSTTPTQIPLSFTNPSALLVFTVLLHLLPPTVVFRRCR